MRPHAMLSRARVLTPLTAALAFALTGCGGLVTVNFDVPIETETVVEGGGLLEELLGQIGFSEFASMDLSSSQQFENNDARKENVTEVFLTSLQLEVTNPGDANLDWLDVIDFYADAPGFERVRVAGKVIDDGLSRVDIDVLNVDLAPYVRAETMTIDTDISARRPPEDTTLTANAVFNVTAEVNQDLLSSLSGGGGETEGDGSE